MLYFKRAEFWHRTGLSAKLVAVRPRASRRAKARPPRPAAVARSVSTTTTATAASLALKHGVTGSRQCAAAILRIPTCEMPTRTELSASGERRPVDDKRDVDETLPRRNVGEICYPKGVRAGCSEVAADRVLCQNSAQPASTKELRLSKSGETLAHEQVTRRPPTLDCGSTFERAAGR